MWPSVTYTFSPSTTAKSGDMNQNFTDVLNNIEKGAPTGIGAEWFTNSAPTGWLLQDGSAVSRTTYARLFAVIGTTYGAGDGSTTFNLPNMKGKVGVGRDSGDTDFDTLAETGGAKTHTLTIAEMPAHQHTSDAASLGQTGSAAHDSAGGGLNQRANGLRAIPSEGGGGAHNNLQPYLVKNYIIKD